MLVVTMVWTCYSSGTIGSNAWEHGSHAWLFAEANRSPVIVHHCPKYHVVTVHSSCRCTIHETLANGLLNCIYHPTTPLSAVVRKAER